MQEESPNIDPQSTAFLNNAIKAYRAWNILREELAKSGPRHLSEWYLAMMDRAEARAQAAHTTWHEAYLKDTTGG